MFRLAPLAVRRFLLVLLAASFLGGCKDRVSPRPAPADHTVVVGPSLKGLMYSEEERPSWLPASVLQVFGSHRFAINGEATCAAFSSDGELVACASAREMTVWDRRGRQIVCLGVSYFVQAISFSNDDHLLLAFQRVNESVRRECGPETPAVYAWRVPGYEPLDVPPELGQDCERAAISSATSFIAIYDEKHVPRWRADCRVRLIDTGTWKETASWKVPPLRNLVFSPDGKELALIAEDRVILRAVGSGGKPQEVQVNRPPLTVCLAYSLDGKHVALSDGYGLSLRDRSLNRIRHLRDQPSHMPGQVTHPVLLSGPESFPILPAPPSIPGPSEPPSWDEPARSPPRTEPSGLSEGSMPAHEIVAAAISPDAKTAFCVQSYYSDPSEDAFAIEAYDTDTGEMRWLRTSVRGVKGLVPSPDGKHLAVWGGSLCHKLDLIPLATGESENPIVRGYGRGTVVLSEDGRLLARSGDNGTTELWEVRSGRKLKTFRQPFLGAPVAFIAAGRELFTFCSKEIGIISLDAEAVSRAQTVAGKNEFVNGVALSADERFAFVAIMKIKGSGRLARYRLPGLEPAGSSDIESEVTETGWHPNQPYCVALSPDQKLVVMGMQTARVEVWDAEALRRVRVLPCPFKPGTNPVHYVTRVAFSPDGRLIAAPTRDGLVYVWDAVSGEQIHRLDVGRSASAVRFGPTSRHLLVGGRGLAAWDLTKPESPCSSMDLRTGVGSISEPIEKGDTTWVALGCGNGLAYLARLELP